MFGIVLSLSPSGSQDGFVDPDSIELANGGTGFGGNGDNAVELGMGSAGPPGAGGSGGVLLGLDGANGLYAH